MKLIKVSMRFFEDWEDRCFEQYRPVNIEELVCKRSGNYVYLNPSCDRFEDIIDDLRSDADYYYSCRADIDSGYQGLCRSAKSVLVQLDKQLS